MTVLILANIGIGLYKFRKELIEELVKTNEVYFSIPNDEYVEQLQLLGGKFIDNQLLDRHGKNPIQDLMLLKHYKRVLNTTKPDIVLTYTIKPNVYGGIACAIKKVPYIVNVTGLGTAIEKDGWIQKISLLLYKIGLRKAQMVFFQNNENRDFMVTNGIVNGEYEVLPGSGVNLSQYRVKPFPNGKTVDFVFVGRVMKEKGIDQYLDAAKEIRKRHSETRFHICGFYEQGYEKRINELVDDGTIIFHGLVQDMTTIYEMVSCVIHPTYYPEGLSNVLLECAASGRPIITTDRSGCREVVEDGVNGYVVKQRDSGDLIDKIEKFLSLSIEERKKMGLAGREKVEKEFDRQIVIKKYVNEIEKMKRSKNEL